MCASLLKLRGIRCKRVHSLVFKTSPNCPRLTEAERKKAKNRKLFLPQNFGAAPARWRYKNRKSQSSNVDMFVPLYAETIIHATMGASVWGRCYDRAIHYWKLCKSTWWTKQHCKRRYTRATGQVPVGPRSRPDFYDHNRNICDFDF